MPFVTEEIYDKLKIWRKPKGKQEQSLVTSPWPTSVKLTSRARKAARGLELVQEIITGARAIRASVGIAPDRKIPITVRTDSKDLRKIMELKELSILRLAQAESITIVAQHESSRGETMEAFSEGEVYINLEGLLDLDKELARLQGEVKDLTGKITGAKKKLENKGFVDNAPPEVVQKERERLEEMEERLPVIKQALARLEN